MRLEMNRRDYIRSLDELRERVAEIGKMYMNAKLASPNEIERERIKKTAKLFGDLAMRLFEDAAVTLKILEANEEAGIGEQGLFDLREAEPEQTQEPPTPETAAPTDADGKGDDTPTKKSGKGKNPGKKGGAK